MLGCANGTSCSLLDSRDLGLVFVATSGDADCGLIPGYGADEEREVGLG